MIVTYANAYSISSALALSSYASYFSSTLFSSFFFFAFIDFHKFAFTVNLIDNEKEKNPKSMVRILKTIRNKIKLL